jgi:hypothetical protein
MIRIVLTVMMMALAMGWGAVVTAAQDEPAAPAGEAPKVEEAAAAGGGERAEIRMRNGMVLSGVVKGRSFEVLRGSHFYPAESADEPGGGIRLWYALGLNGFFFVRHDSVEEIRFLGALSEEEVAKIAADLEDAKARGEMERIRIAAEMAAKKVAAKEDGEGEAQEPAPAPAAEEAPKRLDADRLQKVRDLLKLYPPSEWKPSRLEEIKRRIVILDVFPSEEERGFIDNYDLWLEGWRLWRESQGLPVDEVATPEKQTPTAPEAPEAPKAPEAPEEPPAAE